METDSSTVIHRNKPFNSLTQELIVLQSYMGKQLYSHSKEHTVIQSFTDSNSRAVVHRNKQL